MAGIGERRERRKRWRPNRTAAQRKQTRSERAVLEPMPATCPPLLAVRRNRRGRSQLVRDLDQELDATVGVTPLVVVPAHQLEEPRVQLNRGTGVEDLRVPVVNEVRRGDLFVR